LKNKLGFRDHDNTIKTQETLIHSMNITIVNTIAIMCRAWNPSFLIDNLIAHLEGITQRKIIYINQNNINTNQK